MQNNLKKKKLQSKCVPNEADKREVEQAFKNIFEATNKSVESSVTDAAVEQKLTEIDESLEDSVDVDVTLTSHTTLEENEAENGIKAKLEEIVDSVTTDSKIVVLGCDADSVEIKSIMKEIKCESDVGESQEQDLVSKEAEMDSKFPIEL